MQREVGVPITAGAIVVIPFLVALATPDEPTGPPTSEVGLTVDYDADVFATDPGDRLLRARAPGPQPATATRLVDESGRSVAEVAPAASPADCAKQPLRDTGGATAGQEWCLAVKGLRAGSEVTGTVANGDRTAPVELSLTLRGRHGWGWPLATAAAGLTAALLLIVWPDRLREVVKGALLARYRERNRRAGRNRIHGLDDWVDDRLAEVRPSKVLPVVADLVQHAPAQAKEARASLHKALGEVQLPADYQVRSEAERQANESRHQVGDFVDATGTRVAHPAATMQQALEVVAKHHERYVELQQRAGTLLPACQTRLRATFDRVGKDLRGLRSDEVGDFAATLDRLDGEVWRQETNPRCQPPNAEPKSGSPPAPDQVELGPPDAPAARPVDAWSALFGAGTATLVTFLALTGFALLTVMMTAYALKPTFGTFANYFEVFSTAVASSAAATLLTVLLYWTSDDAAA